MPYSLIRKSYVSPPNDVVNVSGYWPLGSRNSNASNTDYNKSQARFESDHFSFPFTSLPSFSSSLFLLDCGENISTSSARWKSDQCKQLSACPYHHQQQDEIHLTAPSFDLIPFVLLSIQFNLLQIVHLRKYSRILSPDLWLLSSHDVQYTSFPLWLWPC